MAKEIKELKKRSRAFKQYLRSKSGNYLCNYQMKKNKPKDVIRKAKADQLYLILNLILNDCTNIAIRQEQKVLKTVFVHKDIQELPEFPSRVNDSMSTLVITEDLVHNKISKLNTSKACTYYLNFVTICVNLFV